MRVEQNNASDKKHKMQMWWRLLHTHTDTHSHAHSHTDTHSHKTHTDTQTVAYTLYWARGPVGIVGMLR